MMATQLSLLDTDSGDKYPSLITPRHLNQSISGCSGLQEVNEVQGLKFFENFLGADEQAYCVQRVDSAVNEWRNDLSRRVQHYGWRYDYRARAITPDMHIGALPGWLAKLAQKLYDEIGLFDRVPEQVIVNEYSPGQGIAMHIDHPGFGPVVCTVSLLDDWEMDFAERGQDKTPALLPRGSCVLLTGSSRSVWQHGIAPRKAEFGNNGRRNRNRRLSLTFRTVVNRDGLNG
jgi:alkylated DNA repair dioxygenase AlkB